MYYLGIDIGSVSTKFVIINNKLDIVYSSYSKTYGNPISAVQESLKKILEYEENIKAIGVTGSAKNLISKLLNTDIKKNELLAHTYGALHFFPNVKTIIEIGGQDSKLILLDKSNIIDFSLNNLCAAGTGSFLEQQANRLGISIDEFSEEAYNAEKGASISGKCTVFAESDMIHYQQIGLQRKEILYGLCLAMANNYLAELGKGKKILAPIIFQGGVSKNKGMKRAFEEILKTEVYIPQNSELLGAFGIAKIAKEECINSKEFTKFEDLLKPIVSHHFSCKDCENKCEIFYTEINNKIIYWNYRCQKWDK